MLKIERIHHVSLPVSNLTRAKHFYESVLGLQEKEGEEGEKQKRPDFEFEFDGAWYQVGDHELHLIVHDKCESTFRKGKGLDSRDIHFAIRISNYEEAREHLREHGYAPEATDELKRLKESPTNATPWQQLYIMDPDRNVIELNALRP
jgi:catechol 2,3-dioxygenase-like lactoylglutathione lyase family enzyme